MTSAFVACPDGRIIPVRSGVYLHNLPTTEPIDLKSFVRALVDRPARDGARLVHPAPGAEESRVLKHFLAGLPPAVRRYMVIKPPVAGPLDAAAVTKLEELGDSHDRTLDLPPDHALRQSDRALPVNGDGRVTADWDRAVSVRLLTRTQLAARRALLDAIGITSRDPQPSRIRFLEWVERAAKTRDGLKVLDGAHPEVAGTELLAAHIARFGLLPDFNPDRVVSSPMPPTITQAMDAIGVAATKVDVDELVRDLAARPDSAAMVLYRSAPGGPAAVAWLVSVGGGHPGLDWLDPGSEDGPQRIDTTQGADDEHLELLRDPRTRVAPLTPGGRPALVADPPELHPGRLSRAVPLQVAVVDEHLQALVHAQVANGKHLDGVLSELARHQFARETTDFFQVRKARWQVARAVGLLRHAQRGLLVGSDVPMARRLELWGRVTDAAVRFSQVTTKTGNALQHMLEHDAMKSLLAGQEDRIRARLEKVLEYAGKALNASGSLFLPTAMSFAPATVELGTKIVQVAATEAYNTWRLQTYQQEHSAPEAFLGHDAEPSTMAEYILAQQAKGLELLMSAAGIGGAYVPGWALISSGISKVVKGYLEKRLELTKDEAAGRVAPAALRQRLTAAAAQAWVALRNEVIDKGKDSDTYKKVYDAVHGDVDVLGLVNIASDVAIEAAVRAVVTVLPPKPSELVTGEMLRQAVLNVVGTLKVGWVESTPTEATRPRPAYPVPDQLTLDGEGRRVAHLGTGSEVAVDFNGHLVWGELDPATSTFTPKDVDESAFTDAHDWMERLVTADGYVPLKPDGTPGTKVEGSWYQPFEDHYHYLFVHATDGTWEWAHAMSPTAGMDISQYNMHTTFGKHPQWLHDFAWSSAEVLAVDFAEKAHAVGAPSMAMRQLARSIAHDVVAHLETPGGAVTKPLVHVEGGGNGRWTEALHHHDPVDHVVRSGLDRAESARAQLKDLVAEELKRIQQERQLPDDKLPRSLDGYFAEPTSRGAKLGQSRAPGKAGGGGDQVHRQAFAWVTREWVTSGPGGQPAVGDGSRAGRVSPADVMTRALEVGRRPASAAARVRAFVAATEPRPGEGGGMSLADCLPRAAALLIAEGVRPGKGAGPGLLADPASMSLADLQHLAGGPLAPLEDVDGLKSWLAGAPGAKALLHLPAAVGRPAHLYWLWSEPGAGGSTLRWIDSQEPGLLDKEAFADPEDVRALALARPGVRVLRLGADNRPVPAADSGGLTHGVEALTLAPARDTVAKPGAPGAFGRKKAPPAAARPEAPLTLRRASTSFSVFDHNLRGLVDSQVAYGKHLADVLKGLTQHQFIKESLRATWTVRHQRSKVAHAVAQLEHHGEALPAAGERTQVTDALRNKIADSLENLSKISEHAGNRIGDLIEHEALESHLLTREDKVRAWVKRILGITGKGLNAAAPLFLPGAAAFIPPTTDLVIKLAQTAALDAFQSWQERAYLLDHSITEAFLAHDDKPLTMAEAIAERQSEALDLLMSAAGIGGAYAPGWPIISSAITKVVQGYLKARVERAEADEAKLHGAKPVEPAKRWRTVMDKAWQGLREELADKLKDTDTAQQLYKAVRGEAEVLELVHIGSDVVVHAVVGAMVELMPPKPAEAISGDLLRRTVVGVVDKLKVGWTAPEPTVDRSFLPPDETVPANIPDTDSQGRPVVRYIEGRSVPGRAYVAVEFNGHQVWGNLDRGTWDFTPDKLHDSAFTDAEVWRDRIIGKDHYIGLAKDGSGNRVKVNGSWHQPWKNRFHYLFVHADDGTWEWARGAAPTGGMDSDKHHVRLELSKPEHKAWLQHFDWKAPARLDVSPQGVLAGTAARQFTYSFANEMVKYVHTPTATTKPWLRVEGGTLAHQVFSHTTGLARATTLRDKLIELVRQDLKRIQQERGIPDDEMPDSVEEFFAEPTDRKAADHVSSAPRVTATGHQARHNEETYAWNEPQEVEPHPGPRRPSQDVGPHPGPRRPSAVSDSASTGSSGHVSMKDAVQRALAIGGNQATGADRLRGLVTVIEPPDDHAEYSLPDCAPRSYAAFVAHYGRAANRADVQAAADPSKMGIADLEHLLGGSLEPLDDVAGLRDWLLDKPGSMALLRIPAEVGQPSHVFWLWSEPGDDGATLRWVDSQERGLLDKEAFADGGDEHAADVARAGVTVLRMNPAGRPVPLGSAAGLSRGVQALTLARDTPAEPGMRHALKKLAERPGGRSGGGPRPAKVAAPASPGRGGPSDDAPHQGVRRAKPLSVAVTEHQLRALVNAQVANGRHLDGALRELVGHQFVKESTTRLARVSLARLEMSHAIGRLERAARGLGADSNVPMYERDELWDRITDAAEHFSQVAQHVGRSITGLLEDEAVKSYLAGEKDPIKARLGKVLEYTGKALNASGSLFLPTAMPWAPAVVDLGTKLAAAAGMEAYNTWQQWKYLDAHSVPEALLAHNANPLLTAEHILAGQVRGVELLMSAAGIGGAYVPGWPIVSSAVTKVLEGYLQERVERARNQLKGVPPKEVPQRLKAALGKMWDGLKEEVTDKAKETDTYKKVYDAIHGEPDVLGLVNIGSDILVKAALKAVLEVLPPKPSELVTGDMLRDAVLGVVGVLKDGWVESTPTRPAQPLADHPLPEHLTPVSQGRLAHHGPVTESGGKPVPAVVEFNGHLVWGELDPATSTFTAEHPDDSAFTDSRDWLRRTVTADGYIPLQPDGKPGTKVEGSWYKPFRDHYHYLFVHADDGTWEWAHGMAPTAGMDNKRYNMISTFGEHPKWLHDFVWSSSSAETHTVDFGEKAHTVGAASLKDWQLARSFANEVLAFHQGTEPARQPLLNVEGGGNGSSAVAELLRHHHEPSVDHAVETGRQRAASTLNQFKRLVAVELKRIQLERGIPADGMPDSLDRFFAEPTSRGDKLGQSKAPGKASDSHDDGLHRQTHVWVDHVPVTDRLVTAPPGTEWDRRVLALGSWEEAPHELDMIKGWAAAMKRPVVALHAPSASPDSPRVLADAKTMLARFARAGTHPVLYVKAADKNTIDDLRDEYKPVMIRSTTAGMDNVLQLVKPDGDQVDLFDKKPSEDLFKQADRLPGAHTGHQLPRVVADWLALNDWPNREGYLRDHAAELLANADALDGLPADEVGPHTVLLDLVRRNGGVSPKSEPRYAPPRPVTSQLTAPDVAFRRGLPESFVTDYLRPVSSVERKAFNDQLLRQVGKGLRSTADVAHLAAEDQRPAAPDASRVAPDALAPDELRTLTRAVPEKTAAANGTVFDALMEVTEMTKGEVALAVEQLLHAPVAPGTQLAKLFAAITACKVLPEERQNFVYRMDEYRDRLRNLGWSDHATVVEHLTYTMANC